MYPQYLEAAFQDLLHEDGLTVMARGLGMPKLIARTIQLSARAPGCIVFCLHLAGTAEHQLLHHALIASGVDRQQVPKVVTNELTISQREDLYKQGGCFLVTSRILIVDLLDNRVNVSKVSGLVINQAHKVTDTSTEAFIVRIYRQKNRTGFLKAFTDEPEPLLHGFAKMERVLKCLHLRRVFLWPRYHTAIKEYLLKRQPEVIEMAQALTPAMQACQSAILVAMEECLKELKRTTTIDSSELTLSNGIFKAFHSLLRSQLDPEWHRISPKTKQLVQDLSVLRTLLDYILRYDAVTFYSFLISLQRANLQQRYPSPWLASVAADRLYFHAKSRVYQLVETTTEGLESNKRLSLRTVLEENPKWKLLAEILQEVKVDSAGKVTQILEADEAARHPNTIVLVRDTRTRSQLRYYLKHGGPSLLRAHLRHFLEQLDLSSRKKTSRACKGGGSRCGQQGQGRMGTGRAAIAEEEKRLWREEVGRIAEEEAKDAADEGNGSGAVPTTHNRRGRGDAGALILAAERQVGEAVQVLDSSQSDVETGQAGLPDVESENAGVGSGGLGRGSSLRSVRSTGSGQEHARAGKGLHKRRKNDGEEDQAGTTLAMAEQLFQETDVALLDPDEVNGPVEGVLIYTFAEGNQLALLEDMRPRYVVLYDPDPQFVREIEVYQASIEETVRIYFMVYEESVEEQRYMTQLNREKEAFERLVQEKKHMIMPSDFAEVPQEGRYITKLVNDTRCRIRGSRPESVKVVVDVREFRSSLPSLLHQAGLTLVPATLEIGDFVLTPEIVIERKSVSDLFGSFNSGRLFAQVETMIKHYKGATLLIEFQPERAFALQTTGEISADIQVTNIISKMCLLTLHFTELRILWSPSSYATVDLFKALKANNAEVDVTKALTAGGDPLSEEEQAGRNLAAEELLLKLPGINANNYRAVVNKVESLAALCQLSKEELHEVLESEAGAHKLYEFFHTVPPAPSLPMPTGGVASALKAGQDNRVPSTKRKKPAGRPRKKRTGAVGAEQHGAVALDSDSRGDREGIRDFG